MDTQTMWMEIVQQRTELRALHERIGVLEEETDSMRKTIDTVLRLKCKRGEGAFALNINLVSCVQNNAEFALQLALKRLGSTRATDLVVDFIVATLIGPNRTDIPCAVLDTNTFVYKNEHLWVAATLADFSGILSDNVTEVVERATNSDLTDEHVLFYNSIIQTGTFLNCVKKAMKIYKDL